MSKLQPDWRTCGECDGTGTDNTAEPDPCDPDYDVCEECDGEGRVDHNTLPRSTCRPADKRETNQGE